ncbi:hypothetical protein BDF14DRAFT_1762722 [Spinellus fusiger]|nr:hypothetical protein BDF14DRAFT_1762722 [Spinellus fusiger]
MAVEIPVHEHPPISSNSPVSPIPLQKQVEIEDEDEEWRGYPIPASVMEEDEASEKWEGYPVPTTTEDKEDIWTGYPEPSDPSSRRESSLSETSDEWKGYCATSEEAKWEAEAQLKVKEKDWQGYTLETIPDDDIEDSLGLDSQMSRQGSLQEHHYASLAHSQIKTIGKAAARKLQQGQFSDSHPTLPTFPSQS